MQLGKAIKEIRLNKRITQVELANRINISTNAICQIEKDKTFPSKDTITKICKELQISQAYLLLHCLEESDVPTEKREIFKFLHESLKKLC